MSGGNTGSDGTVRGIGDGREEEGAGPNNQRSNNFAGPATLNSSITRNLLTKNQTSVMDWEPNKDLIRTLTEMGFGYVAAKKSLFHTGNNSAEAAISWILENNDADLETPLEFQTFVGKDSDRSMSDNIMRDVFKMVFIVNGSLEMGVGKISAQVAHAAIGMHMILLQDETKFGDSLMKWFELGETKIVLKGQNTQHLIELEKTALEMGLPTYLVQDAGKTQVPVGSTTVLCIFGRIESVDKVSGHLRLL